MVVVALLAYGDVAPSTAAARSARGTLAVRMAGLPSGAKARVIVRGRHGFARTLASGRRLALPAGRYRVVARVVKLRHAYRGIPAGSRAYPSRKIEAVHVKRGRTSTVTVTYGTIVNSHVKALRVQPLAVAGAADAPTSITLPASAGDGLRTGSILAAAPTEQLPDGLFDKVVAVDRHGGKAVLSLAPASLWEAFPSLELETTVPLTTKPLGSDARARPADSLGSVDLSFSHGLIGPLEASCGGPLGGWSFNPSGSIGVSLNVNIVRRYLLLPYGKFSLTLTGKLGMNATIPAGVHCGVTVDGPKLFAVVVVLGIPVPVEGSVNASATVTSSNPINITASAGLSVTGGLSFHGPIATPIVSAKPSASGLVTGDGGEVSFGPEVQVGIGAPAVNGHVDVSPQVIYQSPTAKSGCEIDAALVAGVGLDLGPLHLAENPVDPRAPVYKCPAPPAPPPPPPPPAKPAISFDGSPGTEPPPPTLGGYTMQGFAGDPTEVGAVESAISGPTGEVAFSPALTHELVEDGWNTWSNGYLGDVYADFESLPDESFETVLSLPAKTGAFYLYIEPDNYEDLSITATAQDGSTSGETIVFGEYGAQYFGFYAGCGTSVETIRIRDTGGDSGLGIGEFGIAPTKAGC